MSRFLSWLMIMVVAALFSVTAPALAATPEQVQEAISKGRKYLLSQRKANGTWEIAAAPNAAAKGIIDLDGRQWGGLTAISTYALSASGTNSERQKELKPSYDFLVTANIQSTYGLGLSCQVWPFLSEKDRAAVVKHDVQMILAGVIMPPKGANKLPPSAGFYAYWVGTDAAVYQPKFDPNARNFGKPMPPDWFDRSNSQYGVLGAWALAECGGEIPEWYWKLVDKAWKEAQNNDGGWEYQLGKGVTPSMTAAGIATLFITQDYTLPNDWGNCKGGVSNPNIEAGLKWMDKHIGGILSSGDMYTMYGIERIGVASGRKYFGVVDWFKDGADFLVKTQNPDGSWNSGWPGGPIPGTSWALLFLSRGRAPILMNKLEYASPKSIKNMTDVWNERPRDAANLAAWMYHDTEEYFNWQVVNLKVSADDLHDASILYISGNKDLDFSQPELDKLRSFAVDGGVILGNADCSDKGFSEAFKKLGRKLFPRYEWKLSQPNDVIFSQQYKKFKKKPQLELLDNGVRHLMVLIPNSDPARAWQTRSDKTQQEAFNIGADLFLYSVGGKTTFARKKGQTYIVHPDAAVQAAKTITVARLDLGDNPDPEPGGWPRLSAVMHNRFKIDVKADLVKLDDLKDTKIAHLTGTTKLQLSQAQRDSLKKFVEGGGTLIVDAAGGSGPFADSIENELPAIFGPSAAKDLQVPLPLASAVYNQPDAKITAVTYRETAKGLLAGRTKAPQVRAITVGGRPAVFYSREDLSAGLVGEQIDGIYGYDPQSATEVMSDILMLVAK